jgi:biofilm PGA synthesis N-glycosyltransferase PgaC
MQKVSAFVPCFNNAKTILETIDSIKKQTYPISELFVIDDNSSDESVSILKERDITVYNNEKNFGRGYVRAQAINIAQYDYLLSCDATNLIEENYLSTALTHFEQKDVACCSGNIRNKDTETTCIGRWRGRHLFKEHMILPKAKNTYQMATYSIVMNKGIIKKVGNFNTQLKFDEDRELGSRILKNGYKIIGDPNLITFSNTENTMFQVFERYIRWYSMLSEEKKSYQLFYDLKYGMGYLAKQDLRERDYISSLISIIFPFYLYYQRKSKK